MGGNANVALLLRQLQPGTALVQRRLPAPGLPAAAAPSPAAWDLTRGCRGWGSPSLLWDPAGGIALPRTQTPTPK